MGLGSVRLSFLHGIRNKIVMPTRSGCLYNKIELLSPGIRVVWAVAVPLVFIAQLSHMEL